MKKLILNFLINFITNLMVWCIILLISALNLITNKGILETLFFIFALVGFIIILAIGEDIGKKLKKNLKV
jgi:hypothetical protein